jgi:hypothetical protein
MAVTVKITVLCDVTQCSLVVSFLQYVGIYLPETMPPYPRRQ